MQEQQDIPPLVPVKKKKIQIQSVSPSKKQLSSPLAGSNEAKDLHFLDKNSLGKLIQSMKNKPQQAFFVNKVKPQKAITVEKIQDLNRRFDQKIAVPNKKQEGSNKQVNKKLQEKSKTKYIVTEMLNKISLKNISQQLHPVSNQYINQKIEQIQKQLNDLYLEAEKKQQSILKNQNNRHLKKQLNSIRNSIDHCTIIKELYYEKINFRNKIAILERTILQLKKEKSQMQLEFTKRKQAAQSHALNMPCQRQRELQKQLRLLTIKFEEQEKMKRKLQSNISETINTFKRLYEQADAARMIVVSKLKDIQMRQKKCSQRIIDSLNSDSLRQISPVVNSGASSNRKATERLREVERSQRQRQEVLMARNRQRDQKNLKHNDFRQFSPDQLKEELTPRRRQKQRKTKRQDVKLQQKKMSLQEQIKKMRANQSVVINSIKKF